MRIWLIVSSKKLFAIVEVQGVNSVCHSFTYSWKACTQYLETAEKEIADLEKKKASLEQKLQVEEAKMNDIMASLKTETQGTPGRERGQYLITCIVFPQ